MSISYTITSNEDDTVTFENKDLKIHIQGKTYQQANHVAHLIAKFLSIKKDLEDSSRKLRSLISDLEEVERYSDILKSFDLSVMRMYKDFNQVEKKE